jgi:predicted metal-binding membrane protein
METATLQQPLPQLPAAARIAGVGTLVVLAAAAWLVTADRMEGMDAGPGTDLGGLGWFVGVWVTMMAAMMLPSIAPMVLTHERIESRSRPRRIGATAVFVVGYLVSWAAAGVLGYAIVEGVRSLDLGVLAWDRGGTYVAGGVILLAAVYQLTAWKRGFLRECRRPVPFLLERWRSGRAGALRMGVEHGAYCVGCCWALMAALFALGAMSLVWMAFVAVLIAAEKLLPWRTLASGGIAVVLAALAIAVAFAPESVPGLTIPGMHEMS